MAYVGIFFNLLLAVSAHVAVSDGEFPATLVGVVLILASFFVWGESPKKSITKE